MLLGKFKKQREFEIERVISAACRNFPLQITTPTFRTRDIHNFTYFITTFKINITARYTEEIDLKNGYISLSYNNMLTVYFYSSKKLWAFYPSTIKNYTKQNFTT